VTEPIFARRIRPQDCAILLGIPTDYDGFRRDLGAPNKDLVPNRCPVWPLYRREVVEPAQRLMATARSCGVDVRADAVLSDISRACDGRRSVIIFAGHWTDGRVEFLDGLHPFRAIVEQVPMAFEGFLDLLVCAPDDLAIALRDLRPRSIVRFAMQTNVVPMIWFGVFEALFTSLSEAPRPYMVAFSEITALFLRNGEA
jgi:hypothetical protein